MSVRLAFLTAFFLVAPAGAQTAAPDSLSPSDARVIAALDSLDLIYSVEPNGDYRVEFDLDSGRVQVVWVRPTTDRHDAVEVREVFSIAYETPDSTAAFPTGLAEKLLRENLGFMVGAWAIEDGVVLLISRVAADATPAILMTVIDLTMATADDLDKELNGATDPW